MRDAIRRQLNPATVMAFVALVFATTGGAVAITNHNGSSGGGAAATAAKSKAKPKGKPGPRGPAGPKGETGPAGPAGPTGPAGPAGAKGETGAAGAAGLKGETGAAGTNGKDGASVESTALGEGEGGCSAGGSQFTVNGQTTAACNGEKGEPGETGFTKHLPAGDTETGAYSQIFTGSQSGHELVKQPISFSIPLPVPLLNTRVVTHEEQERSNGKEPPAECQGTVANPTAGKGYLCIYEGVNSVPEGVESAVFGADSPETGTEGVGTTGALLVIFYNPEGGGGGEAQLSGTWAVTAP